MRVFYLPCMLGNSFFSLMSLLPCRGGIIISITTRKEGVNPAVNFVTLAGRTVRYSGPGLNAVCAMDTMLCEDEIQLTPGGVGRKAWKRRVFITSHFNAAINPIGPSTPMKTPH